MVKPDLSEPAELGPFLRLPKVIEEVGLGRSAIYERIKAGTFPPPVPLGGRAVAWPKSRIDNWKRDLMSKCPGS